MDLQPPGKRALVTGASKGIGLAICGQLALEGCNVAMVARNSADLERAAEHLRATTPSTSMTCHAAELSTAADPSRIAEACGDIDILFNNAGSNPPGDLRAVSDTDWRNAWDLRVFGFINLSRLVLDRMFARRTGVVLNVIGYAGDRLRSQYIVGSTGNAALMAFTRSIGSQSPEFGVRVVGVNPGMTGTARAERMLRNWAASKYGDEAHWKEVERSMNPPFGRMSTPEEVADVAVFLASPRASYVSGAVLNVDGGAT